MRRISFFSGDITRSGGTEKVGCQIMNGLCDDYDVSVISLTENNAECFYPIDERVKRIKLFGRNPSGIKEYFSIVHRLKEILVQQQTEILIDIDTILDMFSVAAIKKTPIKLIAWEHFNFYETMGNRFRVPVRRLRTQKADVVVTLTKEDQHNYQREFGRQSSIVQIYNPIEFPEIKAYDVNSRQIISVGRLAKQKGFDYLVDVAANVLSKHSDWSWIILGEGDERETIEKLIIEKNVERLQLLGRVSNVNDFMNKSSIFVMTSRYEGFPLALIEAKANGLPAVSFNCKTGPTELVQDNVNGYLVECFDCDVMADKICDLIENANKRMMFSNNANLDTEKMEYREVIKQWKNVIERIR